MPTEASARLDLLNFIVASARPLQRLVMGVCLGFMRRVVEFEEHNMMSAYNMAVVFAPCFFRGPQLSLSDLENAPYYNNTYHCIVGSSCP